MQASEAACKQAKQHASMEARYAVALYPASAATLHAMQEQEQSSVGMMRAIVLLSGHVRNIA